MMETETANLPVESLIKVNILDDEPYHTEYTFKEVIKNIKNGNINPEGPIIETPNSMKINLKYHQKRLLYEMLEKENITYRVSSGINLFCLGDKVGSGKSIDILALISHSPFVNNTISNKLKYKVTKYSSFKGLVLEPTIEFKTNLIVIPHGIYNQWITYVKTTTSLTYYGISTNKDISKFSFKDLEAGNYNTLIVKSTRYNDFMTAIYNKYPPTINYSKNIVENNIDNLLTDLKSTMSPCWSSLKLNNFDDYFIDNLQILKTKLEEISIDSIKENIVKFGKYKLSTGVHYKGPIFQRVIMDEANSIKIPRCKSVYGKINWFITSSIEDLLEPYGKKDYYAGKVIINGIKGSGFIKDSLAANYGKNYSNFIQDIYLKNKDLFVKNSFNLPEPIEYKISCYTPPELKALQGVALPEVINALNAGDLTSAIQQVGCNISSEKNIVDAVLHTLNTEFNKKSLLLKEKRQLLDTIVNELATLKIKRKEIKSSIKSTEEELLCKDTPLGTLNNLIAYKESKSIELNGNTLIYDTKQSTKSSLIKSIKVFEEQYDSIKFKLDSLKSRITNIEDKDCPICSEKIKSPCLTPCCKNIFCLTCMAQAIHYSPSNECPLCRTKNLTLSKLTAITSEVIDTNESKLPTKLESLIDLIIKSPSGRFLVFSEYENSFNEISSELTNKNITYSKLSGSSGRITNIIENYTNNKIKVLLLNAKHYGSGLNLQMTSDIVIYHRMTNDLEKQIIGRGQRMGRTSPLNIQYLCYDNELL